MGHLWPFWPNLATWLLLAAFGGKYTSFKPRITTAEHEWMKLDTIHHILANCGHLAWSLGPFMGHFGAINDRNHNILGILPRFLDSVSNVSLG